MVAYTLKEITDLDAAPNALGGTDQLLVGQTGGLAVTGQSYATTLSAVATYVNSVAGGTYLQVANDLSDVADAATSRANLGLGTAAVEDIGTSGGTVPLLNAANTWGAQQIHAASNVKFLTDFTHIIHRPASVGTQYYDIWQSDAGFTIFQEGVNGATNARFFNRNDASSGAYLDTILSWANTGDNSLYTIGSAKLFTGRESSLPLSDNAFDLGSGALRFANVYGVNGAFTTVSEGGTALASKYLQIANNLSDLASAAAARTNLGLGTAAVKNTGTFGNVIPLCDGANTFSANQVVDGDLRIARTATNGYLYVDRPAGYAGGVFVRSGSSNRWFYGSDQVAESGSNAGSDFRISAYSDAGGFLGTALRVQRSNLAVVIGGNLLPSTDNTRTLGSASFRMSELFAATGTINTSDAREKTELRPIEARERAAITKIMKGVGVFQWLSSVEKKGEGARLHCGVTAQAVREAFDEEGLDAWQYALLCADPLFETFELETETDGVRDTAERPVMDPTTGEQHMRLGVRYDQLMMMALAVLFQA